MSGLRSVLRLGPKWKRNLCAMCVVLPFLVACGFLVDLYNKKCSESHGNEELETICRLYHSNHVTGNMCSKLCDSQDMRYLYCGGAKTNHKKAIVMECNGCQEAGVKSKVVLKSSGIHKFISSFGHRFSYKGAPKETLDKMHAHITNRFIDRFNKNLTESPNLLKFTIEVMPSMADPAKAAYEDLRSIQSLVDQDEFLAMLVFGQLSFMPELYGTCGPAFIVEYIESFSYLNYVLFSGRPTDILKLPQRFPTWKERAQVGLRVLNLSRVLDTTFNKPLHMCDGMPANLGLNDRGDVILLDSDTIYFDNPIYGTHCKVEWNCYYKSASDVNKTCDTEVVGNNLQRLCKDIFIFKMDGLGLLRRPPAGIASELNSLLRRCASTEGPDARNSRSDTKVMAELERVLSLSLTL